MENSYIYNEKMKLLRDRLSLTKKQFANLIISSEREINLLESNKKVLTKEKFELYKNRADDIVKDNRNIETKICSVSVFKGGVGKTSTILNLSAELARRGYKVLLIDADAQMDLTYSIIPDIDFEEDNNFFNAIINAESFKDIVVHTSYKGIDIVPSQISKESLKIEKILSGVPAYDKRFDISVEEIKNKNEYDFILVDCNNQLGLLAESIWMGSDYIFTVCEPSFYTLKGCKIVYDNYQFLRRLKRDLKYVGVIYNNVRERTSVSGISFQQMEEALPEIKFDSYIRNDENINKSIYNGTPVMYFDRQAKAVEDYREVATEFINRINNLQ